MKYLPIGKQNFKEIITKNYLYVDKTRQIYNLLKNGSLYFLSRPRRFGKSLLVSTLRHLFEGRKALFKDLYIGKQTNYNFDSHPVLQFNFAAFGHKTAHFKEELEQQIKQYATEFEVEITTISLSTSLRTLIEAISKKDKPVVLLIDEYDKPIVDFLREIPKAKKNQDILRDFFSPLKDLEAQGHLHFLFITGVSKFSKISLFSDLNNLIDLTIDPLSEDLLGITGEELTNNFQNYIERGVQHFKMSRPEFLAGVKLWYNGYAYNPDVKLYNPFSLLNFFHKNTFGNFWFSTGTPTFLVETIRDVGVNLLELDSKEVTNTFFDKFSLKDIDITSLLFQTGYLTIKDIQLKGFKTRYQLGYPNEEVRQSMMHNLVEAFTYKSTSVVGNALVKMERGLEEGKVKLFIEQLIILLSDISYHLIPKKKSRKKITPFEVWEGYFQTIIYLVTSFMGLYVQTEITKHQGRLDLLAETDDYLYIMEFKLDEPAKDAIQQIKNRKYAASYKNSPKTVYLVGIGFSKEERNVETWEVEEWK